MRYMGLCKVSTSDVQGPLIMVPATHKNAVDIQDMASR